MCSQKLCTSSVCTMLLPRLTDKLALGLQACLTYAAGLESKAYALSQEIAQADVEELQAKPEQHAAAAGLFRRAAGIYEYAGTEFMQQLTGANQSDRYVLLATLL